MNRLRTPLYHKIYCALKCRIESRQLNEGDLVPAEPELQRMFGASRSPVRQALSMLENEKLVVRLPGKGTFVAAAAEGCQWWLDFSPFRKHFQEGQRSTRSRMLSYEKTIPPDFVRAFFELEPDVPVPHVERLRSVGDRPVIVNQVYVHPQYDLGTPSEVEKFFSLRILLMEKFSVEITRIDDVLAAVRAPDVRIGELLAVSAEHPLLSVTRYMYSEDLPVLIDRAYAVTDIWDYRVTFQKGSDGGVSASTGGR